jgi:ankyrin repeat protein
MMHAVAATQANAVQLLLNRKYKMERKMVLNELFSACRRSDLEKLQKLLQISFQVFPTIAAAAEDGMENTAKATKPTLLMEAVRANCPEAAKELLKYGAPLYPCLVSKDGGQGDSAWSISIDKDNPKLIAVLREGLSQELLQLARADNLPAASNLKAEESRGLAFGPDDFAAADDKGFGVADHVVQRRSELEAWVIERGGRLLSAETRAVALLEPAKNGDYMAICRRLKAGADVGALDAAGRTVLDWSIVAARMNGFVWHAVEAALVTVLSEGDGERSEYGGSETPDVAATPRSSKGPVMKTSFAPTVDEIEPDAVNARLQRIGSTDRVSVTGFSACSSPHGSSSGNRHVRRKKPEPTPDPRHVHAAVEEALIEAGARFGTETARAGVCLWEPLMRRDLDGVRRRIRGGGDCTVLNEKGTSLPNFALDVANANIASLLVNSGASPDTRDHRGRTVLWRAVEGKHEELIDACLQQGADLSLGLGTSGSGDGSLAHLALESDQAELALRFLEGGCSPNKVESHGRTVLWRALEKGNLDVALACLRHGAETSAVDPFTSKTLLHLALERKMNSLVPPLIAAKAPLDLPDRLGHTALSLASSMGDSKAINHIIAEGVHPGPLGGREALGALQAGHLELAEQLIRAAGPLTYNARKWHKASTQGRLLESTQGTLSDTKDSDINWLVEILTYCSQADAYKAAGLCLSGALVGAGLLPDEATKLADDLVAWTFKKTATNIRQTRLEVIQAVPRTIVEEGKESAAGDLLDAGVDDQVVTQLAYLTHEHKSKRNASLRGSMLPRLSLHRSSVASGADEVTPRKSTRCKTMPLHLGKDTRAYGQDEFTLPEDSPSRRMRRSSTAQASLEAFVAQSRHPPAVVAATKEDENGKADDESEFDDEDFEVESQGST